MATSALEVGNDGSCWTHCGNGNIISIESLKEELPILESLRQLVERRASGAVRDLALFDEAYRDVDERRGFEDALIGGKGSQQLLLQDQANKPVVKLRPVEAYSKWKV